VHWHFPEVSEDAVLALIESKLTARELKLSRESIGLRFEVRLSKHHDAKGLAESIKRGDVTQCSFSFRIPRSISVRWTKSPRRGEERLGLSETKAGIVITSAARERELH
jgi:HK97 family phage prohead protease